MKDLLDLGCKTVANMIKGKSVEGMYTLKIVCFLAWCLSSFFANPKSLTLFFLELRVTFHLKNEFTPEEEKKVREENEWCDERQ